MKLAGEMGTLLKIERDIARAIEKGRAEWDDSLPLFRVTHYGFCGRASEQHVKVVPGEREDFWTMAERLLFQALTDYVEAAGASGNTRRRLFAEDAAQGFALADLVAKRFDTALMNPPFGAVSINAKQYLNASYPRTKNDLYYAFVERVTGLLVSNGRVGAITSRNGFFQESGRAFREDIVLKAAPPVVIADLGFGVLDSAVVETAAYVLEKGRTNGSTWFRLINEVDKATALRRQNNKFNVISPEEFARLPGSPLLYWLPDSVFRAFRLFPAFENDQRFVRCGMGTLDDARFVRNWWEVSRIDAWTPFAKGGDLASIFLVI